MYSRAIIRCTKLTVPMLSKLNTLMETQGYQISIQPLKGSEAVPIPWDAWIDIKDDIEGVEQLIIEGGAGPSGFGYCKVMIPLAESIDYVIEFECFDVSMPDWVHFLAVQ